MLILVLVQVMHLFVQEAMLAAVLYTHVKAGGTAPSQRMKIGLILSELHFLSRLLQSEFVYGTAGLETNASLTMAALEKDGVILIEGDLVGLSPEERATGRENFDFYCFLLWPFIEGYWLAGVSLFALTPLLPPPHEDTGVAWYAEKEFQKSAQLLGKNLFYQYVPVLLFLARDGTNLARLFPQAMFPTSKPSTRRLYQTPFKGWLSSE